MASPKFPYIESVTPPPSRAIVVDDGEEDAFILTSLLERAGVGSRSVFRTGEAAIETLDAVANAAEDHGLPSLAFIEVRLPGLNGFELLRWIRESPKLQTMAVVLLSTTDEPRNLGKALQLGADCYMIKFPPMSAMRDVIAKLQDNMAQPLPRAVIPVTCNLLFAASGR